MKAASSGPVEDPKLPPTWKSDCANPCLPPDASRATREDSGWNTDEPMPTNATAIRIAAYVGATDNNSNPINVKAIPIGNEYGLGRASVNVPMTGCSSDAVT